jgi:hypothetical protein
MNHFDQESFSASHSRRIDATVEKVWNAFSSSRDLERSHAFVASQIDMKGAGATGARDDIAYNSGLVMRRNFLHWYEIWADITHPLKMPPTCLGE